MGHMYVSSSGKTEWSNEGNWTNDVFYKDYGGPGGKMSPYESRQYSVSHNFKFLDTGKRPTDAEVDEHQRDRYNPESGEVFSWDQNADHGDGAWANSGMIKPGHPKPGDPGFNAGRDVDWYDTKTYGEQNYGSDFYTVPSVQQKQGDESVPILSQNSV